MKGKHKAEAVFCEHFQVVAFCLLDDVFEYGGISAQKYIPQYLPIMLNNMQSSSNNVLRQCSVYGVAQILKLHAAELLQGFGGHLAQLAQGLFGMIQRDDAKEESNEGVTENALFALGLLITTPALHAQLVAQQCPVEQLAKAWLQGMPLQLDEQESKYSTFALCHAVERSEGAILGLSFSHLSDILRVFAGVLIQAQQLALKRDKEAVVFAQPATVQNIVKVLRTFATNSVVPSHVVQQALASLSPAQQTMLTQALTA